MLNQSIDLIQSVSEFQRHFLQKLKTILNLLGSYKIPSSQPNLEQKERNYTIILHGFKIHHKIIVTKSLQHLYINKLLDQWRGIESTKVKLCICTYGQQLFNKGDKNTQQGKDSLFNYVTKLGIHLEKREIRSSSHTVYKNQCELQIKHNT